MPQFLTLRSLLLILLVVAGMGRATAQGTDASLQASTWEQIMADGRVRMGVVQYAPYWVKNSATGEWNGAMVEMGKSIAEDLGVELEMVETNWNTFVLDIQSGKIDFMLATSATPQRAKVLDFVGPMYELNFMMVNHPDFQGRTWADYNDPGVRIAYVSGSSGADIVERFAPNAQHIGLSKIGEVALAVIAGRADTMQTTTIAALQAKGQHPGLGEVIAPEPLRGLPSYAAIRYETDPRFRSFLGTWGVWNRTLGNIEMWIKDSLALVGVTEIPDSIRF